MILKIFRISLFPLSVLLFCSCCTTTEIFRPPVTQTVFLGEKQMEYSINLMFNEMVVDTPLGLSYYPRITFVNSTKSGDELAKKITRKLRKKHDWVFIDKANAKEAWQLQLFSLTDSEKAASFTVSLTNPKGKKVWQYTGSIKH